MNPKTKWIDRATSEWFAIQHKIYKRCAICNAHGIEAHHLINKNHKVTLHDIENCVPLCIDHHKYSLILSAHGNKKAFLGWLRINLPAKYAYYQANNNRIGHGLTEAYFKAKYKSLQVINKELERDNG